jgi:hypothetical protein
VDKLEDFVKSADKAFTRVDTHLSKIVNTEHKLDTSKKALSRSNSLSDSPQRLNVTHSAMLSSAERDSKMRQLNKFMLQVFSTACEWVLGEGAPTARWDTLYLGNAAARIHRDAPRLAIRYKCDVDCRLGVPPSRVVAKGASHQLAVR